MPESQSELHAATADYAILVHGSWRWDSAPPQVQAAIRHFAEHHPVLVLEESDTLPDDPTSADQPRLQITPASETLTIVRPLLVPAIEEEGETEQGDGTAWERLLDTLMDERRQRDPQHWTRIVHWISSPQVADRRFLYNPVAVVYDSREVSPDTPESRQRHNELRDAADIVFTNEASLDAEQMHQQIDAAVAEKAHVAAADSYASVTDASALAAEAAVATGHASAGDILAGELEEADDEVGAPACKHAGL